MLDAKTGRRTPFRDWVIEQVLQPRYRIPEYKDELRSQKVKTSLHPPSSHRTRNTGVAGAISVMTDLTSTHFTRDSHL